MRIFIPSIARAERVKTLSYFKIPDNVTIVTRKEEYDIYVKHNPYAQVVVCPHKGIMSTRQWILDNYSEDKILMLDDDLIFYTRVNDKKFVKSTRAGVIQMVNLISSHLDNYVYVGIAHKFMSNFTPRNFVIGGRFNDVLAINPTLFPKEKPRFRVEVYEEHDFNLQLRSQGLKPLIITEYTKTNNNYGPGGCSVWRTPEVELKGIQELKRLWPEVVKIVPCKTTLCGVTAHFNWRKLDKEYENSTRS